MYYGKLEKKAFLIPTPGQFEQEYLAKKLKSEYIAPSADQDGFKIEMLNDIMEYSGFKNHPVDTNYQSLFSLFQSE